ncbi:MAG: CTP synthase (glutamine hydrolyzing) [Candidatus Micrarchaeota archaeon]
MQGKEGKERRYIVIAGSLMSGLGKGIVSSSIGRILQSRGLKVVPIKFDGYLNVDCGTMNPYRHGEVFVLDDGTECDMDFGTYERYLRAKLKSINSLTGGKIFRMVIEKERRGGYLGYDVQFVPHLTNEIKKWIRNVGEEFDADVVIVEVGGTVGDLENGYFLEAMRQLGYEEPHVLFIQLTYVPTLVSGEQKTKPTQHATRLLANLGIIPRVIISRESEILRADARKKISMFCNIPEENIIDDLDLDSIYELPLFFEKQNLGDILLSELGFKPRTGDFGQWPGLVRRIRKPKKTLKIGITGKYTQVKDSYVSIKEALVHAGAHINQGVELIWIETTEIEKGQGSTDVLLDCDGIIVPGGFGSRGIEGKIACAKWAREHKLPYFGLCLGLQIAIIDWARSICGLEGANSTEFDPKTPHPVIDLLPEQKKIKDKGATMRLGAHNIELKNGTKAMDIYEAPVICERFRHRYEVNPEYIERLEVGNLVFSGKAQGKNIMQVMELKGHPFFMGTQFHPEFTSSLEKPNPLFLAFMKACAKEK